MEKWFNELDCTEHCHKILKEIGRPVNGKKSLFKMIFILSMFSLSMTANIKGLTVHWDNVEYRFRAIEDFFVLTYESVVLVELYLSPSNMVLLFHLVHRNIFTKTGNFSLAQKEMVSYAKKTEKRRLIQFILMCYMFQLGKAFMQFINGIYYLAGRDSQDVQQENIPMPLQCYYPFSISNITVYVAVVSTQLVTSVTALHASVVWFSSSQASLIHVLKEINILCCFITEMDSRIRQSVHTNPSDSDEMWTSTMESHLRPYVANIVIHHQQIIKSVRDINKAMQLGMFALNYFVVFDGCFNLYGIVVRDDTSTKIKYSMTILAVCTAIFFSCWIGQQLINKCDEFRLTLLKCSWMDKPKWFKKDLQIIMINANKPLEVKPFGLYTLNYNNLAMVTKAAYSCFNVLLTFHIKNVNTANY